MAEASASAPRRRLGWRYAFLTAICVALLATGAVLAWLLGTESGFRALAQRAPQLSGGRLSIEAPRGRLRDHFGFARLVLALGGTRIEARQADLRWRPQALRAHRLHLEQLTAAEVQVRYTSHGGYDTPPPAFALPIAIQIDALRLGQFAVLSQRPGHAPRRVFGLSAAEARADLGLTHWQIAHLAATTDWGRAQLAGSLGPTFPFPIQAQGNLSTRYAAYVINAAVQAHDSLDRLAVDFTAHGAELDARGTARIRSFEHQPLAGLDVVLGTLDPRRFNPAAPSAALTLQAHLAPELDTAPVPHAARLGTTQLAGTVTLHNAHPGALDAGQLPLTQLSARVNWEEGVLNLKALEAQIPGGGQVRGQLAWREPDAKSGDTLGQLEGALTLAGVDPARLHSALPAARVAGTLHARVQRDTQWVEAHLAGRGLQLDTVLSQHAARVEVASLRLAQGAMAITGQGSLTLDDARRFTLKAEAQRFDPNAFWRAAPTGRISGQLSAEGELAPHRSLAARVQLADSQLGGLPLQGGGHFSLNGARISDSDFSLDLLGNTLAVQGAFGAPGDHLAISADAPALDRIGLGLAGRLRARGTLLGSLSQPAGTLDVNASRLAVPGGWRLDALNFQGELNEGQNGRVDTRMTLAGLRRPGTSDPIVRRAAWVATGTRQAHGISVEAQFMRDYRFSARAQGGLSERMAWAGQLTQLSLDWGAALKLTAPTPVSVAADHVALGAAQLKGSHSFVNLEALSWTPQEIVARGTLSGLRVGLALNEAQQVVAQGESLQVGANWDIHLRDHANGQIRVFREEGDLVLGGDAPVALGLTELEGVLAASDDRLAFSLSAAGKRIGVISAAATAAVERHGLQWQLAESAPLLGSAQIKVPSLNWVGPLVDPNLRTGGSVQGDFSLSGTPAAPVATGAIHGDDLSLSLAEQGFRLSGGRLRMRFDADRLYLDELAFVSPNRVKPDERRIAFDALVAEPGRAGVSGQVALATGLGNFNLTADRLPVLQRHDRWLLISGSGQIDTTWDSMSVQATVTAPAGYIGLPPKRAPQLDDDVVVRGRVARSERRFLISTDIDVSLGDALYLKAFGVDTRLEGQLSLHARPGEPLRATGRIETRDGLYDAYGQCLSIDEGIITFQGPLDNPTLAVTAVRKGLPVEAGVEISGTAQRPKLRLVSEPTVPDTEKLSWMILGRSASGGSEADSAVLVAAASALVGDTAGGLTDQIARVVGIDQIALAQSEGHGLGRAYTSKVAGSATGFSSSSASAAADTVGGQVVMLGKRLNQDVFVSFEQSLTGSESIVRLTYALSRHIAMILRLGTENALDVNYAISFR